MPQEAKRPDAVDELMKRVRLSHMRRAADQYRHAGEFCERVAEYYADIAEAEGDMVHTAARRIMRDFGKLHDEYQAEIRRLTDSIAAVEAGDELA